MSKRQRQASTSQQRTDPPRGDAPTGSGEARAMKAPPAPAQQAHAVVTGAQVRLHRITKGSPDRVEETVVPDSEVAKLVSEGWQLP